MVRTSAGPDVPSRGSAPAASDVLRVEGLSVRYHGDSSVFTAVDEVSVTVGAGERVAIVGESGSGKTATCMAIAGFLTDPSADVSARILEVSGVPVGSRRNTRLPRRVPGLSMVFQDATTSLDAVWTIGSQLVDVIRTADRVSTRVARARAEEWLHHVGLRDSERVMASRPYELSGGMRQRAMIALALAGRPRLLIADEPTSALDATLAVEIMELLVRLTAEHGIGVLLVTHDIQLCQRFTDRMLVMYRGRVVEQGRSDVLDLHAQHPYARALFASIPTLESADLDELPTIPAAVLGPVSEVG
jgi:peptide/nickel transport system ATP-binding protein